MNSWEIFFLFLSFQAFLLAAFFLFRRGGFFTYANKLFSLFLFLCGWLIMYNVLFWSKKLNDAPFIHLKTTYILPLSLIGPTFFFYLKHISQGYQFRFKRDFVHALPFLFLLIMNLPYLALTTQEKLKVHSEGTLKQFIFTNAYIELGLSLSITLYGALAFVRFFNAFANDGNLRIWVRVMIICYTGCALSYVAYYLMVYLGVLTLEQDYFITMVMCVSVLTAAYFAFNFPEIFNGRSIGHIVPFVKYKKTGLSENHAEELKEKLLDVMISEKPYLRQELRLDDLANTLGIARHHTSQIINAHFGSHFFDFINVYRVEEAVRLLEENKDRINLAEVGFLSGFNNTVSFNKAFKKNTGLTPSQFRKELLINQS